MRNVSRVGSTLTALVLAFAIVPASPTFAASPTTTVAHADATTAPAGWNALKAKLDSNPQLHKSVSVVAGTKTITYSSSDGLSFVLREPTAGSKGGVQPQISIGGCDWFQVCANLSHDEAELGWMTGGGYVAALVCAASLGTFCLGAMVVYGAIQDAFGKGYCSRGVRIELWPYPGAAWETACYN